MRLLHSHVLACLLLFFLILPHLVVAPGGSSMWSEHLTLASGVLHRPGRALRDSPLQSDVDDGRMEQSMMLEMVAIWCIEDGRLSAGSRAVTAAPLSVGLYQAERSVVLGLPSSETTHTLTSFSSIPPFPSSKAITIQRHRPGTDDQRLFCSNKPCDILARRNYTTRTKLQKSPKMEQQNTSLAGTLTTRCRWV